MHNFLAVRLAIPTISLILIGCGGGGGDDTTCASFTYQEDAQANYAKHLDADNDGIACEALPRRPSGPISPSTGNPTIPSSPAPTVVSSLTFLDTFARSPLVESMSDGQYRFSISAFYTPLAEAYQSAQQRTGGVLSLSPSGFTYFSAFPEIYLSRFRQNYATSEGLAFAHAGVLKATLAGDYVLLGRRCTSDTIDRCTLASGTARVSSSGSFEFCPSASYSNNCASKISYQIDSQPGPASEFVFTPSSFKFGSLRAATANSSTITVVMQLGEDIYSLFGQPLTRTRILNSGTYVLTSLSPDNALASNVTNIIAAPHPIIPGISINGNAEYFLLSDIGLLVTGKQALDSTTFSISFRKLE